MANAAIQKIVDRAESARASLARYKQKAQVNETRVYGSAVALGGAALAGYADAKFGDGAEDVKVLGLPAVPLVGLLAVALGLSDMVPGGQYVCEVGKGALCYALGAMVRSKTEET